MQCNSCENILQRKIYPWRFENHGNNPEHLNPYPKKCLIKWKMSPRLYLSKTLIKKFLLLLVKIKHHCDKIIYLSQQLTSYYHVKLYLDWIIFVAYSEVIYCHLTARVGNSAKYFSWEYELEMLNTMCIYFI